MIWTRDFWGLFAHWLSMTRGNRASFMIGTRWDLCFFEVSRISEIRSFQRVVQKTPVSHRSFQRAVQKTRFVHERPISNGHSVWTRSNFLVALVHSVRSIYFLIDRSATTARCFADRICKRSYSSSLCSFGPDHAEVPKVGGTNVLFFVMLKENGKWTQLIIDNCQYLLAKVLRIWTLGFKWLI